MSTYGRYIPNLIKSASVNMTPNELQNFMQEAEDFTITGSYIQSNIIVPRWNSEDPQWAATEATAIGATNMLNAQNGLGSSIANPNGAGPPPTTSIALAWVKNTGDQIMWVYFVPGDRVGDEPLASSATYYVSVPAGKSTLIYIRVLNQYMWGNTAFDGFLGLSGGWSGNAADPASTADVVILGLEDFWSDTDYT